jgi:serine/threonine protein kinase
VTSPLSPGDHVAGFELLGTLGKGGNASVWCARSTEHGEVALKILDTKNVESERYARFRQEVDALHRIGTRPGVLPLLADSVPARPSKGNPAWLAMPVAEPLEQALSEGTTEQCIEAAAFLAETLADLQEGLHIFHRDLKPSNLYSYDGSAAVGDFGLVSLPDAEQLTRDDKPLGPAYFMPWEMLDNPAGADPAPVDVYSFAKTLWVLLSGQRWPPGGEQAADNSACSLRQYRPHSRIRLIDDLIERCTKHRPSDRPTMREVADDLRAWLRLSTQIDDMPDLSEYRRRLHEIAAPVLSEKELRDRLEGICGALSDRLASLLRLMEAELHDAYPLTEVDVWDESVESILGFRERGSLRIVSQEVRATRLPSGEFHPLVLTIGRCVSVTDDGLAHVRGSFYLGHQGTFGGEYEECEAASVPADSIQATQAVERLAAELRSKVGGWLGRFVDRLSPDSESVT